MNALSHLSPDVLEVVRDVARQEDSFLLRVQGVPLRAFTEANAPRLGPRAPFLSSAERHILEYCRDETAYLFELALFTVQSRESRPDAIQFATLPNSQDALQGLVRSTSLQKPLLGFGSVDDLLRADWRTLARLAMSLRVSSSTVSNVALGWLRDGSLQEARRVVDRLEALRPGPWPDVQATIGHERFISGAFGQAAHAYLDAWRTSHNDSHAACALLNSWMAETKPSADLGAFARKLEGERLTHIATWLRGALNVGLNKSFLPSLLMRAAAATREHKGHPATPLVMEVVR